jgi:tetratricopeptide (TPR) repeat protein
MRKTGLIALLAVVVALPALAQLKLPRASQHAVLTQTVGLTDITITYSRPGVKGRKIFGGLVPYGQVWRTGANEATTIAFSDDVTINGQPLPKGTYSLHSIPGESEWTLIFNKTADQWGSYSYDPKQDALRINVKPLHSEKSAEWLTFSVPELSTDTATFQLHWETVRVPFTVNTHATEKAIAAARAAVAAAKPDDFRTAYSAALFASDNNFTKEANEWIDASIKVKETLGNLYGKARILAAEGKKAEAIKTAEKALTLATDKDKVVADEIRSRIELWKK